jgi:release factor glutamine methyltransferase
MARIAIATSGFILWLAGAKESAIAHSVDEAELDWLLLAVTDLDRLSLKLRSYERKSHIHCEWSLPTLQTKWQQRLHDRVPIQYLVGRTPWRQFDLQVSPAVLIPRPETECVIDYVADVIKRSPELARGPWVDLGTGSGAIAIALADLMPNARIHAVDKSTDALSLAQVNADACGVGDRIRFYHGSWFKPLAALKGQLSGMVSNPPYIPSQEVLGLQREVTGHEPHLALDGGFDGLDALRHLVRFAPEYLVPSGLWIVELMMGQMDAVVDLLDRAEYSGVQRLRDLEGVERFALARSKTEPL